LLKQLLSAFSNWSASSIALLIHFISFGVVPLAEIVALRSLEIASGNRSSQPAGVPLERRAKKRRHRSDQSTSSVPAWQQIMEHGLSNPRPSKK
jgi:hypothetical protein